VAPRRGQAQRPPILTQSLDSFSGARSQWEHEVTERERKVVSEAMDHLAPGKARPFETLPDAQCALDRPGVPMDASPAWSPARPSRGDRRGRRPGGGEAGAAIPLPRGPYHAVTLRRAPALLPRRSEAGSRDGELRLPRFRGTGTLFQDRRKRELRPHQRAGKTDPPRCLTERQCALYDNWRR